MFTIAIATSAIAITLGAIGAPDRLAIRAPNRLAIGAPDIALLAILHAVTDQEYYKQEKDDVTNNYKSNFPTAIITTTSVIQVKVPLGIVITVRYIRLYNKTHNEYCTG